MKLLEEREKRRSLGARPRVLEILNSDLRDRSSGNDRNAGSSSSRNLSYSYQLRKGISGLKSHSLLKELRIAEENNKRKESSETRSLNIRSSSSLEVDLFAEAR